MSYIYIYIYIYTEHPFLMFLDHTQRRSTVGRTPVDQWSARRRDLYLTTHDTHNRQISMPTVGFEPTISAGERPQAYSFEWLQCLHLHGQASSREYKGTKRFRNVAKYLPDDTASSRNSCTANVLQQQLQHIDNDISILTYRAFVWFLSWMYPHVYQQLVTGIERAWSSWTALPEAREVFTFP